MLVRATFAPQKPPGMLLPVPETLEHLRASEIPSGMFPVLSSDTEVPLDPGMSLGAFPVPAGRTSARPRVRF